MTCHTMMRALRSHDRLRQVLGGPTPEAAVDDAPCPLQAVHEFVRAARVILVVLPTGLFHGQAGNGRALDAEEVSGGFPP